MEMPSKTTNELCSFVASRVRAERLRQGYSQEKMAIKAGIALRTYKRFELCGNGTISNLIKILRALDRISVLKYMVLMPKPATPKPTLVERLQQTAERARNL